MKVFLFLAALTGAVTSSFVRNHTYVNKNLNWTDAQAYCRKNYVDLSIFDTQEENDKFQISDVIWIGFSRKSNNENFTQWSDGTPFNLQNWKSGQPENRPQENCGCRMNLKWHDCNCPDPLAFSCFTWEPLVIVVNETKTWYEALEHCRIFYTDLISLSTERDLILIKNKTMEFKTPRFWAGLQFLHGSWFWLNKEPVGNLSWVPSCPVKPFLCGARNQQEDVWENRDCEEKMNFICYHKPK